MTVLYAKTLKSLKYGIWMNREDRNYTYIQATQTSGNVFAHVKTCAAVDVQLYTFLILALEGYKWLLMPLFFNP